MQNIAAVIRDGLVVNTVVWSEQLASQLPDATVVQFDDNDVAAIGWTWDKKDGFRPPQPYLSWSWNKNTMTWEPPVARPEPTDEENPKPYEWDEATLSWIVPQWWFDQQEEQDETEEVG